jgi:hypothetical protein
MTRQQRARLARIARRAPEPEQPKPRFIPRSHTGYPCFDHSGSFEVFHSQKDFNKPGYYWWACFPGCLPDGDACGPFKTAEAAYLDALGDEQ